MGAAKDLWSEEVERTLEKFALGDMEREEAATMLMWLGFFPSEATDMLDEAIS